MACSLGSEQELKKWREKARWNSRIAHLNRIHPNLYLGSRLSVQRILMREPLKDQHGNSHIPSKFHLMCVAGESVCSYSKCYRNSQAFHMRDQVYDDCDAMVQRTLPIADDLYRHLTNGRSVLIHCHAGQNRAAFCIALMAAKYGLVASDDEFVKIMHEDNAHRAISTSLVNYTMRSCVRNYWERTGKKKRAQQRST